MDKDQEREEAQLKALEALYQAYADEFEEIERTRDHILFEHAGALDQEKVEELKATVLTTPNPS